MTFANSCRQSDRREIPGYSPLSPASLPPLFLSMGVAIWVLSDVPRTYSPVHIIFFSGSSQS